MIAGRVSTGVEANSEVDDVVWLVRHPHKLRSNNVTAKVVK